MTRYVTTVNADGNFYICDVNKKRDMPQWFAGVIAAGTFGGGTITFGISPNRGVTIVPLMDASGTPITSTANDDFTLNFGGSSTNSTAPWIYATMAGSAGANVTIYLYDNNG